MKYINGNPYDYNTIVNKYISRKKDIDIELAPDAQLMIVDPIYHFVGTWLGINMHSDWNKNYKKIFLVTEYAKHKAKSDDLNQIVDVLKEVLNAAPQIAERRIDDLVCEVKLRLALKNEKPKDHNGYEEDNEETKKKEVLSNE